MTTIATAYDRYCKRRFPLPSDAQLADVENRIGVQFPEDFRRFVLSFNGGYFDCPEIEAVGEGCPAEALNSMFGIGAPSEGAELGRRCDIELFDDNDPPKIVPIGSTAFGGLIILDTAPGEGRGQIFLKQAFGDFYLVAENIEGFFGLLRGTAEG